MINKSAYKRFFSAGNPIIEKEEENKESKNITVPTIDQPIQQPIEQPSSIRQLPSIDEEVDEESDEDTDEDEDIPINPILYEKADILEEKEETKEEETKKEETKKEETKEETKEESKEEETKEEKIDESIELLQEIQNTDIYLAKSGKKYDYLIKENLSLYPGQIPTDIKTTVHLCMYSIVLDSYKPFIQYLLCLSNNIYDFPSYQTNIKEELVDEETWIEEFKSHFFDIFPDRIAKYFMPNMEEYYKGIIEQEYESSLEIFIFFDISTIPPQLLQDNPFNKSLIPENFILSPIHEFYNLRAIGNTPINNQIEKLFYENDFLLDIREHSSQTIVEYPYVLFLCDKEAGFFGNSSYKNITRPFGPPATYSICLPKIVNEKMGEFYFFTSKPIDTAAINLRRFAVFIDEESTLFINKEGDESKFENLYDEDAESYSSVHMFDGETQFWVIKSLIHIMEL